MSDRLYTVETGSSAQVVAKMLRVLFFPGGWAVTRRYPGPQREDLTGRRFGRLTVIRADSDPGQRVRWWCVCDCGEEKSISRAQLIKGTTVSCGCFRREAGIARNRDHGLSKTRAYQTWNHMRHRCSNPKAKDFLEYGARGIAVCQRWQSFENFYADMGDPPDGMTIDRIDNDRGYEPGNCRWASAATQSRNRRYCLVVEHDGKRQTLEEWARDIGVSPSLLRRRYHAGDRPPHLFRTPMKDRLLAEATHAR